MMLPLKDILSCRSHSSEKIAGPVQTAAKNSASSSERKQEAESGLLSYSLLPLRAIPE
jgi:hypothetical protein